MMKVGEFLSKLQLAASVKTIYATGAFGAWCGDSGQKQRYADNYPDNAKKILAAGDDTWIFDCIGLIKGILWGWNAGKVSPYGGAGYEVNGVPDMYIPDMEKYCSEWHTSIKESEMIPGAVMRIMKGNSRHVGVYIGNGQVIECTPAWKNGAQITKLSQQSWQQWGLLKYVDYTQPQPQPTIDWEKKYNELYNAADKFLKLMGR